jgi:hypothetical protein
MGRGIRLQLSLTVGDRERIEALLSGGVQEVRTVVRALALRQLDRGLSTPEVGFLVGLAGKTVRQIGQRYLAFGLERALFDAPRPGKVPSLDPGPQTAVRQRVVKAWRAIVGKLTPKSGRVAVSCMSVSLRQALDALRVWPQGSRRLLSTSAVSLLSRSVAYPDLHSDWSPLTAR